MRGPAGGAPTLGESADAGDVSPPAGVLDRRGQAMKISATGANQHTMSAPLTPGLTEYGAHNTATNTTVAARRKRRALTTPPPSLRLATRSRRPRQERQSHERARSAPAQ